MLESDYVQGKVLTCPGKVIISLSQALGSTKAMLVLAGGVYPSATAVSGICLPRLSAPSGQRWWRGDGGRTPGHQREALQVPRIRSNRFV